MVSYPLDCPLHSKKLTENYHGMGIWGNSLQEENALRYEKSPKRIYNMNNEKVEILQSLSAL